MIVSSIDTSWVRSLLVTAIDGFMANGDMSLLLNSFAFPDVFPEMVRPSYFTGCIFGCFDTVESYLLA